MESEMDAFKNAAEALIKSSRLLLLHKDHHDNTDNDNQDCHNLHSSQKQSEEHLHSLLSALEFIKSQEENYRNDGNGNADISNGDVDGNDQNLMIRTSMKYNNKVQKVTLRALLNSRTIQKLSQVLSSLMSYRLVNDINSIYEDVEEHDEEENGHGNKSGNDDHDEWTLSPLALLAARLYIDLSSMGGSWGVGWIDVGIMRSVEALVRRWGDECRGKSLRRPGGKGARTNAGKSKRGRSMEVITADRVNTRSDDDQSGSEGEYTSKLKRRRDEENEYEGEYDELVEKQKTRVMEGKKSVMQCGLRLANALSESLKCVDYWNWSKDARDAILDAAISALGIVSALIAPFDQDGSITSMCADASMSAGMGRRCSDPVGVVSRKGKGRIFDEVLFCAIVLKELREAAEYCIVKRIQSTSDSDFARYADNDNEMEDLVLGVHRNRLSSSASSTSSTHSGSVVSFLRAVYPLLTCQIDLPNGVKGKSSAYKNASELVINILKVLSHRVKAIRIDKSDSNRAIASSSLRKTPASRRGRRDGVTQSISKARTPRSTQKGLASARKTPRSKRKSFDGTLIVPPSLKKSVTPKVSRRHSFGSRVRSRNQDIQQTPGRIRTSSILDLFVGLMQKISTSRGMEKANVRARVASFLKGCLNELPEVHKTTFLRFIPKLCRSKVSSHRIFGVELIGSCLLMEWLWKGSISSSNIANIAVAGNHREDARTSVTSGRDSEFPSCNFSCFVTDEGDIPSELICTLHGRLNDISPAVRSRAASALCTTLKAVSDIENSISQSRLEQILANFKIPLLELLRKRSSSDGKAVVRRSAITALVELILFNNDAADTLEDVVVLSEKCNDASLAVRKSAADAIISLIIQQQKNWKNLAVVHGLEAAWADAVLPLVHDVENSCAAKVVESFLELVINPIVESDYAVDVVTNAEYQSAWRILSKINTSSSSAGSFKGAKNALNVALKKSFEMTEISYQRKICVTLFKILHTNIIEDLESDAEEEEKYKVNERAMGSWCLLEAFTSLNSGTRQTETGSLNINKEIKRSAIGTEFLVDCWEHFSTRNRSSNLRSNEAGNNASAGSCLRVISVLAPMMTNDEAGKLFTSLQTSLKSFSLDIDIIGLSVSALVQLTRRLNNQSVGDTQTASKTWISALLMVCESNLNTFVSPNGVLTKNLDKVLYTCGELIMVGFCPGEETYNKELSVLKHPPSRSNEIGGNCIRGLRIKPSSQLCRLVQSLLLRSLPKQGIGGEEIVIPNQLRAHAFVTFGKMCLRDEILAKTNINLFARELRQEEDYSDPAVKSNALLVLGDFCIRYTNHVDKFIPLMASCLQPVDDFARQDKSQCIVRHHAILILSNLILQDYVKWKGVLFYRFLAATVDEDSSVANLAKLLLCGPLLTKQPSLFFNNFVDALFILNGCTAHPMFTKRDNKDALSFQAEGLNYFRIENSNKRHEIYSLLLDHISDEEKIGSTARLSKEVLSAATEMKGELRSAASNSSGNTRIGGAYSVLSDCFQILTNPRMQIGRTAQTEDETDANITSISNGPSQVQLSNAKGKLLSKISRKHLIETVIPILCNLKTILEKSRSPLLRNLMQYLVCIFRQFKKEVNETLASNQTLLQEIKYDTRQFERDEKKSEDSQLQSIEIAVA